MKSIQRIWRTVLDIFFPAVCANCGKYAGNEKLNDIICRACFDLIRINSVWLPGASNMIVAAAGSYGDKPLRELVHLLKYGGIEKSAAVLANVISKYLDQVGLANIIDINNAAIVPVPLHPERLKKRGFNQSELIAKEVGKALGIKVINALKRVRNTSPQIDMKDDRDRKANLKGAFALRGNAETAAGLDLILIDDVYTSGATMEAAIKALKELRPRKTIALVAARARN